MQLIPILLMATAALAVLTGFSVFIGTSKSARANAAWFFVSTVGAAVWAVAIASFLAFPATYGTQFFAWLVVGIIAGITVTDVALIGYTNWHKKSGKFLTILFAIFGIAIVAILVAKPSVFYSEIELGGQYNQINTVVGWYYFVLIGYYTLASLLFTAAIADQAKRTKNKGIKTGLKIFQTGLSIGGLLALIFDLILLKTTPSLIWIGPMAVSISIITFYYSVIRHRVVLLSTGWMKILSYIILIVAGVVLYLLAFYAVFTALFHIPNPSPAVLLLNFVMIAIVLCLVPAISEVSTFMKSLIATKQIDIGYITKKMNRLTKRNVELKELAGFLADHLHFEYVGFLINGRLYGSGVLDASSDEFVAIANLKSPVRGIWQEPNAVVNKIFMELDIKNVAELRNTKDEAFGQVLIGRPINRKALDRREMIQVEMVINLAAAIIDAERRPKI